MGYNPQAVRSRREQACKDFGLTRNGNYRECARLLDVGITKFWELARREDFPKPLKIGRLSRWPLSEVWAWSQAKRESGEAL